MNTNDGFSSNNLIFERWNVLIKLLFGAQDMLEIVQNDDKELSAKPTDAQRATFKDSKKKDLKALLYIDQNMDAYYFEKISKVLKSKETWNILHKYHDGGEKVKQARLQSLGEIMR